MVEKQLLRWYPFVDPSNDESRRAAFREAVVQARPANLDGWVEIVRLLVGRDSRCFPSSNFSGAQKKLAAALLLSAEFLAPRKTGLSIALLVHAHRFGREDDTHPFVTIDPSATARVERDSGRPPAAEAVLFKDALSAIERVAVESTKAERAESAKEAGNKVRRIRRHVASVNELLKVERYVTDLPNEQSSVDRAIAMSIGLVSQLSNLPPPRGAVTRWCGLGLAGHADQAIPISSLSGKLSATERTADLLPLLRAAASADEQVLPIAVFVDQAMAEAMAVRAMGESQ